MTFFSIRNTALFAFTTTVFMGLSGVIWGSFHPAVYLGLTVVIAAMTAPLWFTQSPIELGSFFFSTAMLFLILFSDYNAVLETDTAGLAYLYLTAAGITTLTFLTTLPRLVRA